MRPRGLRSIPGTLLVCGIVVSYIAYLEGRNAVIKVVRRLKKIKEP